MSDPTRSTHDGFHPSESLFATCLDDQEYGPLKTEILIVQISYSIFRFLHASFKWLV